MIIPYGKQFITDEDIAEVNKVLASEFLTQGPKVKEFEDAFAQYIGCKYAVAVSNGTAALHLSAMALNVQPGDKVLTTPITFAASANCVLYCGGEIDFVDIDPDTYLMDLDKLEEKLSSATAGIYKGIIPVDFSGLPINTERLRKIADQYGLWIIEDACHAPGGNFFDSKNNLVKCGDGKYAELSIFSFHPVKHIAAGEGGMVTTNDKGLYEKLLLFRTHGITKSPELLIENHGGWYYEMQELGYNYRLTDFQSALGLSQLQRANLGLEVRNQIALRYNHAFTSSKIKLQKNISDYFHAYHLYIIQVEDRKGLYDYLREHNIFAQVHYIPVHLQPYYQKLGWKKGDMPEAEKYYGNCLSLPMFPALSVEEQDFVIDKILQFINE